MKKVVLDKEFSDKENRHSFEFHYRGETDVVDFENKVATLLDRFGSLTYHSDMVRNVTFLRTILKESKESLLDISYTDDNCFEKITYRDGRIFLYSEERKEPLKYNVEYDQAHNLSFSCPNLDEKILDNHYNYCADILKTIGEKLQKLKNAVSLEMNDDDKLLVEIYQDFYQENPDFSNLDVELKYQTMMIVLANFDICIFNHYSFNRIWSDTDMIGSLQLTFDIQKLYPFGEVSTVESQLKESVKKEIHMIGKTLLESIPQDELKESLITIGRVIWAGRYQLLEKQDPKQIVKLSNRSEEEVSSCIQLVKKIEDRIEQN